MLFNRLGVPMALKKTVKKRRRAKRKVVSMEAITETLMEGKNISDANKRALDRLNAAEKALARHDKQVESNSAKVEKARTAFSNAKTPAAKEKAKARLTDAQTILKEVKAERTAAMGEVRKATRLAKGLYKALQAAQTKMVKDFEKTAKILEKAVDKRTRRRRRTSKKRVAVEA
jgi:hypothetical protein